MHPARWVTDANAALLTDLYQLTMVQSYLEHGLTEPAAFELFARRLPGDRNFLLTAGLDDVLGYLETLRFSASGLSYLGSLGRFSTELLAYLEGFRFSGDVRAIVEGTPVFAGEPIVEVVAPLPEAQLVETFVLNQIHLQTMVASKAARVVAAAAGRDVVDFRPPPRARRGCRAEVRTGGAPCGRQRHLQRAGGPGLWDPGCRDDGAQLCAGA